MEKTRTLPTRYTSVLLVSVLVCLAAIGFAACSRREPEGRPSFNQTQDGDFLAISQTPTETPQPEGTAWSTKAPWPTFAEPIQASVTQVPPQADPLAIGDDVSVWLLLGMANEAPGAARTDAIHVLIVNERLSKASVVSIPGNLFVYLPGHHMQRISTAFALGGMPLMRDTLAYNFGLRPDRFVLAHAEEFQWFVDDLGGLDVSVLFPIRDDCDGLPSGIHHLDGAKTLCYVSTMKDGDEVSRTRRQQQVLQLLFTKLVQDGRLSELPMLYLSYQEKLDTDLGLSDFLQRIPMALRLGDPLRISYFLLGWESVSVWELPDHTKTNVLLPKTDAVAQVFEQALAKVEDASPLGEIVVTYQWQLTQAVAGTQTQQPLQPQITYGAPTRTSTPRPSKTPLPPVYTPGAGITSTPGHPYP